jgi:hypothetical protein
VGRSTRLRGDECAAWKTLHSALGGQAWRQCAGLWDDPCGCERVQCSADGTRLTGLDLSRNQLAGGIPSTLSKLSALTRLDLSHNLLSDGFVADAFAPLTRLDTLLLDDNIFTGQAPPLDYSRYTTCDIGNNTFGCPMPPAAATCHRRWQPPPACAREPLSPACAAGMGKVFQDEPATRALQSVEQVGQQLSQAAGRACGGQIMGSDAHKCFVELDWSAHQAEVGALRAALRDVNASGCFVDYHKDQLCDSWGTGGHFPCEINLGRNGVQPVPDACTAADRAEMRVWSAQPAYCERGGEGNCSITWSDPKQCAAPPAK